MLLQIFFFLEMSGWGISFLENTCCLNALNIPLDSVKSRYILYELCPYSFSNFFGGKEGILQKFGRKNKTVSSLLLLKVFFLQGKRKISLWLIFEQIVHIDTVGMTEFLTGNSRQEPAAFQCYNCYWLRTLFMFFNHNTFFQVI